MTTVSLGGSLMLDGLRLVGMSKRESLLEIGRKEHIAAENVAMKLAKVTPPRCCFPWGHTQDVSFPGVALSC